MPPAVPAAGAPRTVSGIPGSALGLALALAIALAYAGSLDGAFVLDDRTMIVEQPEIDRFDPISETLVAFGGKNSPASGRPVVALSFMANLLLDEGRDASVGRHDPRGYRIFNVAVHVLATLALFGLMRRTFARLPGLAASSLPLAAAIALLWGLHPLQTSAVTYISQRAESLMGLFVLSSLYAASRAMGQGGARWAAASVAACALGAASKEVAALTPLLVLAWDRAYVSASLRGALREHRGLYLGLFGCWILTAALLATDPRPDSVALSVRGLNPLNYLLTQGNAIAIYLGSAFWPSSLVLDYGWPVVPVAGVSDLLPQFWSYGPAFLAIAALGIAGCVLWTRRPEWGFPAIAFFAILGPSSSVLPVATEIMAEHRMYLPLACVLSGVGAGLALAGTAAIRRFGGSPRYALPIGALLVLVAALALGAQTWRQNALYRSEVALWEANLRHTPENPRVLLDLGLALAREGRRKEAIERLKASVQASAAIEIPKAPILNFALENTAALLVADGRPAAAARYYQQALRFDRGNLNLHLRLGAALAASGNPRGAIAVQRAALRLAPGFAPARWNLVGLLLQNGKEDEARREVATLLGVESDSPRVEAELRSVAEKLGRPDLAP